MDEVIAWDKNGPIDCEVFNPPSLSKQILRAIRRPPEQQARDWAQAELSKAAPQPSIFSKFQSY
jgi:hypothetical protein